MSRLFNLVSHPAVISVLGVVAAFILFPNPIVKYRLVFEAVKKGADIYKQYTSSDLDHDGTIEQLMLSNYPTNANITVMDQEGAYLSTHNLPGFWYTAPDYFLGDADRDGTVEMYALSVSKSDTLFLSRLSITGEKRDIVSLPVCLLERHNGELDHFIFCGGLLDLSGDGKPECVFQVSAGFSLQPRRFYAWDMARDSILQSPLSGINYAADFLIDQSLLTLGKKALICCSNSGTNNYNSPIPYPDSASWAVVLTQELDYLFEPVYCGGPQSRTSTAPFRYLGDDCILASTVHLRRGSHRNTLRVLDYNGGTLLSRDSIDLDNIRHSFRSMGQTYLVSNGGLSTRILRLNPDLSYEKVLELDGKYSPGFLGNLDNDPDNELLMFSTTHAKIAVIDDRISHASILDLPELGKGIYNVSLKKIERTSSIVSIHSGGANLDLKYARSPFYHFRWAYYLVVYLITSGLLFALQYIFVYRSRKKREMEEKVTNLQLQAVMNQLSPHFTFNAINSIGSAIVKGKKDEAYEYFTRLSDLIRMSMLNAFETHTTLEKELDFVRQYLIIEAYRAQGKLEWEVETDPEVDLSLTIPKMLIHLFVENAIKHGIFHLKDRGQIDVRVKQTGVGVLIMVRDNGVGFKKAFEIEKRKGKGLLILDNYLAILNRRQKHKISYKILDNSEPEHEDSGATILITIQL